MLRQGILRPSILPKLALCAWYRPQDNQSEAAARGSDVDQIYRDMIIGLRDFPSGSAAEIAAADWAVGQTDQVAGKNPVLARKEDCEVRIPGFPKTYEIRSQHKSW